MMCYQIGIASYRQAHIVITNIQTYKDRRWPLITPIQKFLKKLQRLQVLDHLPINSTVRIESRKQRKQLKRTIN